jgi:hypothetical protein
VTVIVGRLIPAGIGVPTCRTHYATHLLRSEDEEALSLVNFD